MTIAAHQPAIGARRRGWNSFRFTWRPDSVTALKVWLGLVLFIPGALVVPAVGAAGRPAVLFGCAFILWWMASRLVTREPVTHHLIRIALLGYAAVYLVAYAGGYVRGLNGTESLGSDRSLLITLVHVAVALLAIEFIPNRRRFDDLVLFLIYGGAIVSLTGMLQFWLRFDIAARISIPGLSPNGGGSINAIGSRSGFTRPDALSGHAIAYGVFMAFLFPIAAHYTLHARTRLQRRWRAIATLVIIIGVPISVSRSSVIVFAISALFLASAWSPQMLRRSGVAAVFGVLVFRALVPSLLGTIKSLFTGLGHDPSIQGRTNDYAEVFTYIGERPWLGRGPGTFGPADYILLDNDIIGTIVQIGYIGLTAYLLVFVVATFVAMRLAFRGPSDEIRHLANAMGGAIFASMVSLYFADMAFFAHWIGPTFLLLGLIGTLDRLRYEPSESVADGQEFLKERRRVRRPALVAIGPHST